MLDNWDKIDIVISVPLSGNENFNLINIGSGNSFKQVSRKMGYRDQTVLLNGNILTIDNKNDKTGSAALLGKKLPGTYNSLINLSENYENPVIVTDHVRFKTTCGIEGQTQTMSIVFPNITNGISKLEGSFNIILDNLGEMTT